MDDYSGMKYQAVLEPAEDEGFLVTYPDLPGVMGRGETAESALKNAEARRLDWIQSRLDRGLWVPRPGELADCKGALSVRIPVTLHRRLKLRARDEGVSLNQMAAFLLAWGVDRRDFYPQEGGDRENI